MRFFQQIIIPFVILLSILIVFIMVDNSFDEQITDLELKIAEIPMQVFIYDYEMMHELQALLSEKEFVSKISLETNIDALKNMIAEYELQGIEDIIDTSLLPNIVEVNFDGAAYSAESFNQLQQEVKAIIANYGFLMFSQDNADEYQHTISKLSMTNKIFKIALFMCLFFVSILVGNRQLYITNSFWYAYHRSGGSKTRIYSYLKFCLLGMFLPLVLAFGGKLLLNNYAGFNYSLDLISIVIIVGLMIIACFSNWLVGRED